VIDLFLRRVIYPNWPRYIIVAAACFAYAFISSWAGPTWYRAEALLAFKNRSDAEQTNITRIMVNPIPVAFEEEPVEDQYDLATLFYSVNLANRVIGDEFEELYDPKEYDDLTDFYVKFLSRLEYDYDGDKKVVHLAYLYKDPEKAAEFCNRFATAVEQFMQEIVDSSAVTPILLRRLETASAEAETADAEANRIAETYGVPNLVVQPKEWGAAYQTAIERALSSQVRLEAITEALQEVRASRERRDLLEPPVGAPDVTIVQDLVLGALRLRADLLNVTIELGTEVLPEDSARQQQARSELDFLNEYLSSQYKQGLDVETRSLLMRLQVYMAENRLYSARADATLERLERIPRLEAEVRPVLRKANVARTVAFTLQKLANIFGMAEEYGIDPIRLFDPALPPNRPVEPAWNTLMYLLPSALFVATLWFGLVARMLGAADRVARARCLAGEEQ
jgi:hypothetical protein